ncbi:MAG: cysteine--tRNA ligase, partial [Synechococcus sp. MED-G135]
KDGEPSWDSPWGPGRPGWHIECSAMVRQEFGPTIDIHLGGGDLVFPHHENEIAQSETANGEPLAKLWMHNGMVNVGGTKMSKSLGNFTTIRALLDDGVSAMTLRLFVLQAHYRKPLDFTKEALDAATTGWKGLNAAIALGRQHAAALRWPDAPGLSKGAQTASASQNDGFDSFRERFITAMDDDLNSSGALAVLFDLARPLRGIANRLDRGDQPEQSTEELADLRNRWLLLRELAAVLGLSEEEHPGAEQAGAADDATIQAAIEARKAAKAAKNFAEADRIRAALTAQGIELIDKPGGITEWRRA